MNFSPIPFNVFHVPSLQLTTLLVSSFQIFVPRASNHIGHSYKKFTTIIELPFILPSDLRSVGCNQFFFIYNIHFSAHWTPHPSMAAPLGPSTTSYTPGYTYSLCLFYAHIICKNTLHCILSPLYISNLKCVCILSVYS